MSFFFKCSECDQRLSAPMVSVTKLLTDKRQVYTIRCFNCGMRYRVDPVNVKIKKLGKENVATIKNRR